ncbi:family 16 glycosylhydrolase [Streptosporangium sp. NPDC023825]|uniref:golvesin C-terminal-like domain-containing protein n=1 Tax=Streptosporangium sp. NPDC023825 TaxID=3154909 RepID=UPI00344591AB
MPTLRRPSLMLCAGLVIASALSVTTGVATADEVRTTAGVATVEGARTHTGKPWTLVKTVFDPEYRESGGWLPGALSGFAGGQARYTNKPGDTASWTLTAPKAGAYQVDVWYPPFHTSAGNAEYTVTPGGRTHVVNQREGGGYWRPLGPVVARAGQDVTVTLTAGPDLTPVDPLDEYTRTYAVRLRRGGPANPPPPDGPGLGDYRLAFADEFTKPIDWANGPWDPRTDVRGNSSQRAANVRFDPDVPGSDGAAVIDLKAETDRGKPFTGGGLVSKDLMRYGYYETRVWINKGPGWHPAFWSMCGGANGVHKCQLAEIDGFEIDSIHPNRVIHNVFDHRPPRRQVTSGWYDVGTDLSQGWHVFGYEYDEAGVRFFVDGRQRAYLAYPAGPFVHDSMKVWLTAVAYNDYPDPAALPATAAFDYFRYYEKDYYADNDGPTAAGYAESGPGWAASSLPGFGALTSRYSCDPGAAASWKVTAKAGGRYEAFVYRTGAEGGNTQARVTLSRGGAQLMMRRVDFSAAGAEWVSLGEVDASAGDEFTVGLARDGAGCIRADTVKLVRTGNGR